jgi:ribosome-associated protein
MEDLVINENITIPSEQLTISAVRSSGPGGQNVNKVSTCIELRFSPKNCPELSETAINKLLAANKNKLDSEDCLIITSQQFREQYRNIEDARNKLRNLILEALKVRKKRRPTKPTKASIEERMTSKKIQSQKKASRSKKYDE